jgi:hypothetical protein
MLRFVAVPHTHIDKPEQEYYLYAGTVKYCYTFLALKVHFVLTFFADYSRIVLKH